jgi:1-acyl-sn-glycerol-3-phosphate acyltransferase
VPVVPVAVSGTDFLWPFRRIEVSIGKPILPDPPAWWGLSQRVATIVQRVGNAITSGLERRRRSRPADTS